MRRIPEFLSYTPQPIAHLDEDRQRFARIERDLDIIKTSQAIRDKIGFKQ